VIFGTGRRRLERFPTESDAARRVTADDTLDVANPPKQCASCGREMAWRRSWAANWDSVRYCSDACRRRKVSAVDERLGSVILELLQARSAGATICPSEAARAVAPEGWRELMEPARRAARRMVADGVVEITQSGRVVNPSTAKGPIRIRLATRQPEADGNRGSRRADERS
jgi:hypothetical protein